MKTIVIYVPRWRKPYGSSGEYDYSLEAQYSEEAANMSIKAHISEKQTGPENNDDLEDFDGFEIDPVELQVPDDFVIPTGV